MDDLPGLVTRQGLAIGVIATSGTGAQDACDALVAAGVRSVLNFAPVVLSVPPEVTAPAGSESGRAASAWSMSKVMAMISPSKRVALGHMSRCNALACAKRPNALPRNA